ncbi:hypothetical protein HOK51_06155 [Candidatus Woesearchaeota archaeon]|jgi:hypothetical protein|nr:hypothetical protein [Candidatus Woesearchaeota archaeon]MBT6519408.1 hypothetical protein [Candidatus Woesearchaeota archaeon]MBT7368080.1 hypothetical protein [Candidatus Woesearchaeota archaeon]
MKKIILNIILVIILCTPVFGLGIGSSGDLYPSIEFYPDKSYSFYYLLRTKATGVNDYMFFARGDLAEYVSFDPPIIKNKKISRTDYTTFPFHINIDLPPKVDKPGIHEIIVDIIEKKSGLKSMITAYPKVEVKIKVRVLYEGYKIESRLSVPNLNENEKGLARIHIENIGSKKIDKISAKIDIFDSDKQQVTTLFTKEHSIAIRGSTSLEADFDSTGFPSGNYSAIAEITYDDGTEYLNDSFMIGTKVVKVIDHSKNITVDTIEPFSFKIISHWNNPLNVYAKVYLQGKEFQTATVNIGNLETEQLKTYIDTNGMETGEHDVDITLFYQDGTTNYKGKIDVLKKPLNMNTAMFIGGTNWTIVSFVFILIILNILILLVLKKKKKQKQEVTESTLEADFEPKEPIQNP